MPLVEMLSPPFGAGDAASAASGIGSFRAYWRPSLPPTSPSSARQSRTGLRAHKSRSTRRPEGTAMHTSNESLLVILFVGLIAGFFASRIVHGSGFGVVGDIL